MLERVGRNVKVAPALLEPQRHLLKRFAGHDALQRVDPPALNPVHLPSMRQAKAAGTRGEISLASGKCLYQTLLAHFRVRG